MKKCSLQNAHSKLSYGFFIISRIYSCFEYEFHLAFFVHCSGIISVFGVVFNAVVADTVSFGLFVCSFLYQILYTSLRVFYVIFMLTIGFFMILIKINPTNDGEVLHFQSPSSNHINSFALLISH